MRLLPLKGLHSVMTAYKFWTHRAKATHLLPTREESSYTYSMKAARRHLSGDTEYSWVTLRVITKHGVPGGHPPARQVLRDGQCCRWIRTDGLLACILSYPSRLWTHTFYGPTDRSQQHARLKKVSTTSTINDFLFWVPLNCSCKNLLAFSVSAIKRIYTSLLYITWR
jgi:hypothetical protein